MLKFNKSTKIATALAAVILTLSGCGSSSEESVGTGEGTTVEQQEQQSAETYKDIDTGELKEVQIYDFPEESMFEILHGVKYGMTKEDVKSIEGEPTEEGIYTLSYDTSINNYQAVLLYKFFLFEPGDKQTQYQNVTEAEFDIALDGLTDTQIYNEFRDIRKTYIEKYGEPASSVAFAIDNPDLNMDGYPDIDGEIDFNGDPFMVDKYNVQNGIEIEIKYYNSDLDGKGIEIRYICENPLTNPNI